MGGYRRAPLLQSTGERSSRAREHTDAIDVPDKEGPVSDCSTLLVCSPQGKGFTDGHLVDFNNAHLVLSKCVTKRLSSPFGCRP